MSTETITARLDRYTALRAGLQAKAEGMVTNLVQGFGGWYDHDAITQMATQAVGIVEAAQRGLAHATDAYLSQVVTEMIATNYLPAGPIDPSGLRAGVTHPGVYGRLADQYRLAASQGLAHDVIMAALLARAGSMVATDLALAVTHQSKRTLGRDSRIIGYRRVVRTYRSKGRTCGLCLAASDRFYRRSDLMPLHNRCVCDVLPITATKDPGRELNRAELDRLYDEAGGKTAGALVRTRYEVQTHGEIGPVLIQQGHHHRGPDDVALALAA